MILSLHRSARRLGSSIRGTLRRSVLGPVSALGTGEHTSRTRDHFMDPAHYASTRKPVDEASTLNPVSRVQGKRSVTRSDLRTPAVAE